MKPLAPNTLIQGRYLIVHLIGKGGMGEVYLAVDQRLGSAIALKRTYFAGDEVLGNAFEREARTLARMRHPVLPKVSDHFGEGEQQYLVMEHIAGEDLAKRIEVAQKPFPVSWVMFWADQLLDALSYLHSHEPPIIHRDIKPQNLKLTDENHIILLDFGLSKTSTGQTHVSNSGSSGSVVGYTPHYAPMEQIRGIGTSARSDLYSLSATLYQLVTNTIPDDALTRAETILNGLPDPIEPPHILNPEVPEAVSRVILKGLEVSQEKRYANAREMQKELRRAYSKIQEAMTAQTVAFNVADVMPTEQRTQLMPSEPLVSVAPPPAPKPSLPAPELPKPVEAEKELDLEATLAFDPPEEFQTVHAAEPVNNRVPPVESRIEVPTGVRAEPAPADHVAQSSFVTVAAGSPRVFADAVSEPARAQPQAIGERRATKKSGKTAVIVGGIAAFLILGLGAAGGAWYYYNNYAASAVAVEPSPSPEATVPEPPIPAPPSDASLSVDTSTANTITPGDQVNSNSAPTAFSNDPAAPQTESPSRPTQPSVRPQTNRPATTAQRPTPKPKAKTGRTDIEQ